MTTPFARQIAALQADMTRQRRLVDRQADQIDAQRRVLDLQFRRMADIQAELDLVKATVRLASPAIALTLIGPQPPRMPSLLFVSRPPLAAAESAALSPSTGRSVLAISRSVAN